MALTAGPRGICLHPTSRLQEVLRGAVRAAPGPSVQGPHRISGGSSRDSWGLFRSCACSALYPETNPSLTPTPDGFLGSSRVRVLGIRVNETIPVSGDLLSSVEDRFSFF